MEIAPSNPSHQATSKQPHHQHRAVIASWCTACRQLSSPPDTEAKQRDVTPTITPLPSCCRPLCPSGRRSGPSPGKRFTPDSCPRINPGPPACRCVLTCVGVSQSLHTHNSFSPCVSPNTPFSHQQPQFRPQLVLSPPRTQQERARTSHAHNSTYSHLHLENITRANKHPQYSAISRPDLRWTPEAQKAPAAKGSRFPRYVLPVPMLWVPRYLVLRTSIHRYAPAAVPLATPVTPLATPPPFLPAQVPTRPPTYHSSPNAQIPPCFSPSHTSSTLIHTHPRPSTHTPKSESLHPILPPWPPPNYPRPEIGPRTSLCPPADADASVYTQPTGMLRTLGRAADFSLVLAETSLAVPSPSSPQALVRPVARPFLLICCCTSCPLVLPPFRVRID